LRKFQHVGRINHTLAKGIRATSKVSFERSGLPWLRFKKKGPEEIPGLRHFG